ncbi:MAG: enoyl-CoA hydratase-related protein [Solirubrobacterales bacterium]
MPAHETIRVTRDGAVAVVELQRPDSLNAINLAMGEELLDALRAIAGDRDIGAVVLTGAGRAFSSGADVRDIGGGLTPSGRPDVAGRLRGTLNPITLTLREMPQPVIAAVNGIAAGIGCSYALACDLVLAARSASLLLAFVNVALVPDGGASLLVSARGGLGCALEMSLLGEPLPAERAHAYGLVNRIEDDERLRGAALETAARLAAGPPETHAAIKRLLNEPYLEPLRRQLELEADAQALRVESAEAVEALGAFLQKRAPRFRG